MTKIIKVTAKNADDYYYGDGEAESIIEIYESVSSFLAANKAEIASLLESEGWKSPATVAIGEKIVPSTFIDNFLIHVPKMGFGYEDYRSATGESLDIKDGVVGYSLSTLASNKNAAFFVGIDYEKVLSKEAVDYIKKHRSAAAKRAKTLAVTNAKRKATIEAKKLAKLAAKLEKSGYEVVKK